jgi:hypothetical protein
MTHASRLFANAGLHRPAVFIGEVVCRSSNSINGFIGVPIMVVMMGCNAESLSAGLCRRDCFHLVPGR